MPGSNYNYSTGEFLFDSPEFNSSRQTTPQLTPKPVNQSTFDPEEGMYDAYIEARNTAIGADASKRKQERFYKKFRKQWDQGEALRRSEFNWNQSMTEANNQLDTIQQNFKNNLNNLVKTTQDSINNKQLVNTPVEKPAPKPFNTRYWLSEAQRINPNFKSIDDVIAWQKENGLVADGKFGKNSINKWREQNTPSAAPSNARTITIGGRQSSVNADDYGYDPDDMVQTNKVVDTRNSKYNKQQNGFTNLMLGAAMAENPAVMTAGGWRETASGDLVQDQQNNKDVERLRNNLAVLGGVTTAGTVGALAAAPTTVAASNSTSLVPVANAGNSMGNTIVPNIVGQVENTIIPNVVSNGANQLVRQGTGQLVRQGAGQVVRGANQAGRTAGQRMIGGQRMLPGNGQQALPGSGKRFGWMQDIANDVTWFRNGGNINKFAGGGNMNDQELQKAFMTYLIEDAAAQGMQIQSEQDLQAYAQHLGEEGLKAKYQEFMQKMQGGVKAALGAKLNYINKLKGNCPDGYEMVYMKEGGRFCQVCQKKAEKASGGKKLSEKKNAISDFKEKRKAVNPNDTVHVGGKPKSLTNADGSRVDKRFPAYTNEDYKKDKNTKDGQKRRMKADLVSSEKCGGKTKKKK